MNILIIRTIQSDLLGALLNSLHDEFPTANLYLHDNLKQKSFSEAQHHIGGCVFWTKRKGDYGIANISFQTIAQIRKFKFDKVIIPHKQYDINGFDNVILLLLFLNIKKWFHCSIDWKLRKIKKNYLIKMILNIILAVPIFLILLPIGLLSFLYLFVTEKVLHLKQKDIEPWKCSPEDL